MFQKTKLSALEEIRKENVPLAEILQSVNELLQKARVKLRYITRFLQEYNFSEVDHKQITIEEFLSSNLQTLTKIEELLEKEDALEHDEKKMHLIFRKEIQSLEEAKKNLRELRRILQKENAFFQYIRRGTKEKNWFKIMSALSKLVAREVRLLEIESPLVQKVSGQLQQMEKRIRLYGKMPIVKSLYYHASPFLFNVGDKVKESLPRKEELGKVHKVEEIFEQVRREQFPSRPSRLGAIYCGTDPNLLSQYWGIVYAVKVEGLAFTADQEQFTEARIEYDGPRKNRGILRDRARAYWSGKQPNMPEVIVNGTVTILGLADYVRVHDRIEIIVDWLYDDDGNLIPKRSQGIITAYYYFMKDLPFQALLNDGREVSLPAGTFKKIKK